MRLQSRVNLRLSTEEKYKYEDRAVGLGVSLAEYLRQQLESSNDEKETLLKCNKEKSSSKAIMLEILLLLRQIAQPRQVNLAQSELKRLGFSVWSSNNDL